MLIATEFMETALGAGAYNAAFVLGKNSFNSFILPRGKTKYKWRESS